MFMVSPRRDDPSDPEYPVVVCPTCMTRWFGHRDDKESKPLDPRLPAALRDAIILDQAEAAFAILEHELGYSKAVRPNAIVGASTRLDIVIEPRQGAQLVARPQTSVFIPTHFITGVDGFTIDDIRIGNCSQFIQAGSFPSEAFRMNVSAPDLIMRPGEELGEAMLEIVGEELGELPPACSAFNWNRCEQAMDIITVVTNVSQEPRAFTAWFLGKEPPRAKQKPMTRALFGERANAAAAAWNQITGPGLLAQAGDIDEPE